MSTPFTYTDKKLARKARRFCRKAHRGQVDKQGKPYYKHPFAVAALHDVVEDTDKRCNAIAVIPPIAQVDANREV